MRNQPHRINLIQPIISVLLIGILFFTLYFLEKRVLTNSLTLGFWNFNIISPNRFIFGSVIFLSLLATSFYFPVIVNKFVMLACAGILATCFYGKLSFILFAAAIFLYFLATLQIRDWVKAAMFLTVLAVFQYIIFDIFLPNSDIHFWYAYLFAMFVPVRFLMFLHHSAGNKTKQDSLLDYLLYIFCPAYFIIFPHMVILPRYGYFTGSLVPPENRYTAILSGAKKFLFGLIALAVIRFLQQAFFHGYYDFVYSKVPAISIEAMLLTSLPLFITAVLIVYGYGNICLGLVRSLGYEIKSPFNYPLLANDIVNLFDRYLIYFKEYIWTFFYFPLVIIFKRINRYAMLFLSVWIGVGVGFTAYSYLTLASEFCSIYNNYIRGHFLVGKLYEKQIDFSPSFLGYQKHIFINVMLWALFVGFLFAAQSVITEFKRSAIYQKKLARNYLMKTFFYACQYIYMLIVFTFIIFGSGYLYRLVQR